MAAPIETLYIELQGRLDGLERTLKQAEQRLEQAGKDGGQAFSKGFGGGVDQVIAKVGSIGGILAGGAIGLGVFDGLVRSVTSLASEADRARVSADLLAATLEKNGISAETAARSIEQTASSLGVLPQTLNDSTKLLINYGASLEDVAKLQTIGGASALAAGRDAATGAQLIAEAITTENSALLNGIGIASNLSVAYQNYAKEVGKTTNELTNQEKAQAAVNYLLKETQAEVEALPTLLGGLAGSTNEINQRFTQLRQALGEQLIPVVNGALKGLIGFLDILPTIASAATALAVVIGAQKLAGAFPILNQGIGAAVESLKGWATTSNLASTATTTLSTAMTRFGAFLATNWVGVIAVAVAGLTALIGQIDAAATKAAEAQTRLFNASVADTQKLRATGTALDDLRVRIINLQSALEAGLVVDATATRLQIAQLVIEYNKLAEAQKTAGQATVSVRIDFEKARQLMDAYAKALASGSEQAVYLAKAQLDAFRSTQEGAKALETVQALESARTKAQKELTKSQNELTDAQKAAQKAAEQWSSFLKAERLDAYNRSLLGLSEAQLRTEIANQRAAQSVDKLQAATQQLNEIQQRRIALERELAAQQANAPIQTTIARLAQQYDLANISLQEYLTAINRYLTVFSQQLNVTAKGTDEYERLRGIIIQLRGVQQQLTLELEAQADAQAKLAASAPLLNTISGLADAYKAGSISAREYADALESLIRSLAQQRNSFAQGSIDYERLDQTIRSLRETQRSLVPDVREATEVLAQQAAQARETAQALRIIDESGRFEIFDTIAKQYVALQKVLEDGQVTDAAKATADALRKSFTNVRIDEATRTAIGNLLEQFDALKTKSQESSLPDNTIRNFLQLSGIDFGNIDDLRAALANIPASLGATSTLFRDFNVLVNLAAEAQGKLAEAAGLALTENQKLANQIKALVENLVASDSITVDAALAYIDLALALESVGPPADDVVNKFRVLSGISFENFTELSVKLESALTPIEGVNNAFGLFEQVLRAAVAAEQDLGIALDQSENKYRTQADSLRLLTARLAATGEAGADVIQSLTNLSNALDVRAEAEDAAAALKKVDDSVKNVKQGFATFTALNLPGLEDVESLAEGITRLIGGDVLGGIQRILAPYADVLQPILEPLARAFGDMLSTLNPVISAFGELLNGVVVPLVQVITAVLLPIMQALGAAIKIVADGVKFLFQGIITIYNATIGQLFGQIGSFEADGLIIRVQETIGKISDAAREAILEMSRTVRQTLESSFASALSDGLFEAIETGDLDTAKKALEDRLKKIVVQVIIDTAVKAALATAAVAEVLKALSDEIAYAIATGDWSGVGAAITAAVSTVTGIMEQLGNVLTPVLGGLLPPTTGRPGGPNPGGGGGNQPINPFAVQQLPLSPAITVPLLDSATLISDGGTKLNDASTALIDGLKELELDSVASDMARSSRDFRVAVDDLGALLTNRTNWSQVGSR